MFRLKGLAQPPKNPSTTLEKLIYLERANQIFSEAILAQGKTHALIFKIALSLGCLLLMFEGSILVSDETQNIKCIGSIFVLICLLLERRIYINKSRENLLRDIPLTTQQKKNIHNLLHLATVKFNVNASNCELLQIIDCAIDSLNQRQVVYMKSGY
jgi:hypothetical protein